jgi:hypothetical protein
MLPVAKAIQKKSDNHKKWGTKNDKLGNYYLQKLRTSSRYCHKSIFAS